MTTQVYLVELSGQGDHWRFLVCKETFDWVCNGGPLPLVTASAMIRNKIGEDTVEKTIATHAPANYSGSSMDNDRAMSIMGEIGAEIFYSTKDMNKFMKENDMEIAEDGEYEGYIY